MFKLYCRQQSCPGFYLGTKLNLRVQLFYFLGENMDLKKPTLIEEQIDTLASHGILINDREVAVEALSEIGYYRLSGYLLQYRKSKCDSDLCRDISFDEILKLYHFDEELRNYLRKYIEIEEVFYKTLIANTFSLIKCTKPPYDQHYDLNNYYLKEDVSNLLNKFENNKKYYVGSLVLEHHLEHYNGKFPLWVMMGMVTLSDASKYYSCLYYSDQNRIAALVNTNSKILSNHLHCISVLRNKCAHAARLYNITLNPPAKFGPDFYKKNKEVANNSLFAYIIVLTKRLPNKTYKVEFVDGLIKLIEENKDFVDVKLMGFPENYKEILNRYKKYY